MKEKHNRIRDLITTIIAYAVISGPIIILVVMMAFSCYEKVKSTIHLPFEKKVYYTVDGEFYHDSQDCPALKNSDRVYTAYRKELTGKTPCEQCFAGD